MPISQTKFKEMLREKGLKVTGQRILVLEVLESHKEEHLTVEEIFAEVQKKNPEIGLATVYRTVQLLLDMQLVDRINFDDGCVRYETGHLADGCKHHHHHLVCEVCGKVLSFEADLLDELEQYIEQTTGFKVMDHELKFFGMCQECTQKKKETEK